MVSLSKLGYFTAKMSYSSSELRSGERAGEVVGKAVANQHERSHVRLLRTLLKPTPVVDTLHSSFQRVFSTHDCNARNELQPKVVRSNVTATKEGRTSGQIRSR